MKVNINMTVDVDPETWKLNFGQETTAEVRQDVKNHVLSSVDAMLRDQQLGSVR